MAKDPAFLFYYQDFLVGTAFMSNEETGAYIKILSHLADKRKISLKDIQAICRNDAVTNIILNKLKKDEEGMYYNIRLSEEIKKRKKFTESRRNNLKGKNKKKTSKTFCDNIHMDSHMENENVNEIEDDNANVIVNINERKGHISKKVPPSIDEITERCIIMNYPDHQNQAERFYDYYESIGWKVGKNKMRNWHSALANWYKNLKKWNSENKINKNGKGNSKAEQSIRSGLEAIELLSGCGGTICEN